MRPGRKVLLATTSATALAVAAACSSGGGGGPGPTPTPTPFRVYASAYEQCGSSCFQYFIDVFPTPLTAGSPPSLRVPIPLDSDAGYLAVDALGTVANCSFGAKVMIFSPPISASSTTSAVLNVGCGGMAFDSIGNLFVATQSANGVELFAPPFVNGAVATRKITTGLTTPVSVAFDAAGMLYVADEGATTVVAFAPPYNTPAFTIHAFDGPNLRGVALDRAGDLFVADLGANTQLGAVNVFKPPLSATSTTAFTLTAGINKPEQLATDPAGGLYLSNAGGASTSSETLAFYAPPFSATSVPRAVLGTPGTPFLSSFGVAIGP